MSELTYFEIKAREAFMRLQAQRDAEMSSFEPKPDEYAVDFSKCQLAQAYPRCDGHVVLRGDVRP